MIDLAHVLGHELCHAWDLQVADAPPDDDWFHFADANAVPARGREEREAFAEACGLGPELVVRTAAVACGASASEAGLAHVAGDVFPSAPDPGADTRGVHTVVALPAGLSPAEVDELQACEVDGGSLAVGFRQGLLVRWFELGDPGLVEVDRGWCGLGPRPERVAWTRSGSGAQVAAGWAGTEVAWVQVPWPAGTLHRVWVRRAGGDWRSSMLSCGLPHEPWPGLFSGGELQSAHTTFVASATGRVSLTLGEAGLHVVRW